MIAKEPFEKEKNAGYLSLNKNSLFREKEKEYEIPKLKLLDDMVAIFKNNNLPDLSNTIFIGVQHILETTVTLFDALIELGVKPENMYFSGKCYSTSSKIAHQVKKRKIKLMESNKPEDFGEYEKYCLRNIAKMWKLLIDEIKNRNIDRIIILDEGGRCLETMPRFLPFKYKVAAIEQTRGGLYIKSTRLLPIPLIEVASCTVKKLLEPSLIAEAIIRRVEDVIDNLNPDKESIIFGVIGNGAIGYGICKFLLSQNYTVVVYDENEAIFENVVHKNLFRFGSIEKIIVSADIIFGCTGKDITEGIDVFSLVTGSRIFISCSSEDKEFRSLLRTIARNNVELIDTLSDVTALTKQGGKITIFQGGFPFNFDRKPWNVPANSIEITQGLLLGACIQAITCANQLIDTSEANVINQSSLQSLDCYIQSYAALHWLERQSKINYPENYYSLFKDLEWIQKNSGGEYYENTFMNKCFLNISAKEEHAEQAYQLPKAKL